MTKLPTLSIALVLLVGCNGEAGPSSTVQVNLSTFAFDAEAAVFRDAFGSDVIVPDQLYIHLANRPSICRDQFDYFAEPRGTHEVLVVISNPRPGTCPVAPRGPLLYGDVPLFEDASSGACQAIILLKSYAEQRRPAWRVPAVDGSVSLETRADGSLAVTIDALFPIGAVGEGPCFENEPGAPTLYYCRCSPTADSEYEWCGTDLLENCCNAGKPTERLLLTFDADYCPIVEGYSPIAPGHPEACSTIRPGDLNPDCGAACSSLRRICIEHYWGCEPADSSCEAPGCDELEAHCALLCEQAQLAPMRTAILACLSDYVDIDTLTSCVESSCVPW